MSIRKAFADDLSIEIRIKADKPGVALPFDLVPLVQDLLHRAACQHIVRIDAGVQLRVDIGVGYVVGGVHTAIFLVDVLNCKAIVAALPITHQLGGVIRRAVVHDQPDKILAALAAKAFVGTRQGVCAIVGRGEDGKNGISSFVHKPSNKTPVVLLLL